MNKVRLGDICRITMGQSPDSSTYNDDGIGVPFYQGNADFGKLHPTAVHWCTEPKKTAEKGDILISVRAPIGALNIANEHCCIGRGLASITVNEDVAERDYIWYLLKSKDSYLQSKGTGSTFKAINKNVLFELPVDLPSKNEQKSISDLLSKSFELATRYNIQLIKLDELIKSRFVEMFGDPITNEYKWERVDLGDICRIQSSKRVFEKDYVSNGIPFLRTKEIVELANRKPISTELFISTEHFNSLKCKYGTPKKNDLLVSAVGTIGTIWIVDGNFDFYYKDGNIIQIKSSERFNSLFMKHLLEKLIHNYKNEMSTGTAYSALTIVGLKKMKAYDVPLAQQNKFADFVTQVEKQKVTVQQSIDKLETLKKSLMQEYFG